MINCRNYDTEGIYPPKQLAIIRKPSGSVLFGKLLSDFGIDINYANQLALRKRCIYASMMLAKMAHTYHAYADLLHEKLTSCLSADKPREIL